MVRVRIFYQTDPAGTIPGGIDTFIRGIIKAAPGDIEISVVGLTNRCGRPGRSADGRSARSTGAPFAFFSVGHLKDRAAAAVCPCRCC